VVQSRNVVCGNRDKYLLSRSPRRPTLTDLQTITTESSSPEHLLRELKFNQSCHSEFIVKFYGAFVMKGQTTAIAMEYCEGRSLEAVYKMIVTRGGRTNERVLGKIACGVLGGLTYLHEKHIVHRGYPHMKPRW
jgi:mitogen-activated protein kinase kinase